MTFASRRSGTAVANVKSAPLVRDFMKRVLDCGKGIELDRIGLAVPFLDPADIDVLHDVAGFRIDRDRAARTFPAHPFHGANERIRIGLADPGLKARFAEVGATPLVYSPAEIRTVDEKDTERWAKVVKAAGNAPE